MKIINQLRAVSAAALTLAQRDGPTDARGIASEILADSGVVASKREAQARLHQTTRVITVVTITAVALIGALIFSEMYGTMQPALNETQLNTEATNIVEGFGDAMAFVPIVIIVLLATLVIGVVRQM